MLAERTERKTQEHAETFRHLLGQNLELLSFEERQAVVQCLISKVVVTGVQVDIYYVLPFVSAPQLCPGPTSMPEGTPGLFCRLRLAERAVSATGQARWPVWGGSGRRTRTDTRLVPEPPDPHLGRLSLSGGILHHIIRWNVRNGSWHGAAQQCESANACIYNMRHTAPVDERPPCAETVCGKVYQWGQCLLSH